MHFTVECIQLDTDGRSTRRRSAAPSGGSVGGIVLLSDMHVKCAVVLQSACAYDVVSH